MELKAYLGILLGKWWVIIPTFLVTLTSTVVMTFSEIPIYKATSTYVVSFSDVAGGVRDSISVLSLVSREESVTGTYAEFAMSKQIKNKAADVILGANGIKFTKSDYAVSSRLLAGTIVLEITVEGPNPQITKLLADAIGEETKKFGDNILLTYKLIRLDEASVPKTPIKPDKKRNVLFGAVFGLILGGGLAFLVEYLTMPSQVVVEPVLATSSVIIQPKEEEIKTKDSKTGAYTKEYFFKRLDKEIQEASKKNLPLSVAMMRIEIPDLREEVISQNSIPINEVRFDLLRQFSEFAIDYLPDDKHIISFFHDSMFAFLIPLTDGEGAKSVMNEVRTQIDWKLFQSPLHRQHLYELKTTIGVATYDYNGVSPNKLIENAKEALHQAERDNKEEPYVLIPVSDALPS